MHGWAEHKTSADTESEGPRMCMHVRMEVMDRGGMEDEVEDD